jgi:hypothetical protein
MYSGIFQDSSMATILVVLLIKNLGVIYAFQAKIVAVMLAIEIANRKGLNLLWIETDSTLVTLAYRNPSMISWIHRNCSLNCVELTKDMFSIISHIYR